MKRLLLTGLIGSAIFAPALACAQTSSFRDVPASHPAAGAIEYLKAQGILTGYDDGTFRPEATVNRSEALKIIVASRATKDALPTPAHSVFSDVPEGSWFLPYVAYAEGTLGIIDGPPDTTLFHPTRTVNKAEFLKMFLAAKGVDAAGILSEIRDGLASDVPTSDVWYYPQMRYAIASSMIMVADDGTLRPGQELTRAQVALLLYRYEMFTQNRRTQALLTEAETEITNVRSLLERKDTTNAGFAATRSTIAARGALLSAPSEPIVKGAVKMSEAFQSLVAAYAAGMSGDNDTTIARAGDAWNGAAKAAAFNPGLSTIASDLQAIAGALAEDARALKEEQQ